NQTIPALERLSKEGEYGRNKINQYTRVLTVPLALLQGIGVAVFMQKQGVLNAFGPSDLATTLSILASLTAGTIILMWLGELISERGIGNGISFIIFASILAIWISLLPNQVAPYFTTSDTEWLRNLSTAIVQFFQNAVFYNLTYFILVVASTFFYTAFTFVPNDVADNIKRYGGFIPG